MARKRFVLFNYCQSILRFSSLMLSTILICMIVSPALANLSKINVSNIQNLESRVNEDAKVLYDTGRFTEAAQVLQQVVEKYRQQGDTVKVAAALSNMSLVYQQLGEWSKAEGAIAQSLSLLGYQQAGSRGARENPQVLAQTLDIYGRLQLAMGQSESALATWMTAADVYKQTANQSGVVRALINQAQALRVQGFYRRAEAKLEEVYQNLQSQPDSIEKATSLRSLGDVVQLVGDLSKSRKYLETSLEIAQRLKSPTEISNTLVSLGNNARVQRQKEQAISFYQKTVKVSQSPLIRVQAQLNLLSLFVEDQQLANSLALIPLIQSQLEQLPPSRATVYARINFVQSLQKLESRGVGEPASLLATAVQQARKLGDKRAEAYALGSLGGLYEQNGQVSEAQKLTEQALVLAQVSNAPEITYRWQWQLGRLLKKQKDFPKAIAAYDGAVQTLESLRSDLVKVNQDVQFTFRDSVEPVYRESVELLLLAQQGQPDAKTLEKARERIEALQLAELDNFFREACLQGQKVVLDQVVDRDNPTAAILYPIILPEKLQVIVKIPKQPLRLYSTNISQTEVEKTISGLRQNLVKPSAQRITRIQSQQVYNWLIKPIESELQASGVNTLVFVPDGVLRNLPPSVLYDGKQYLLEKYSVSLSVGLQLFNPKPLVRQRLNALTAGLTQPPPNSKFPPLPAIKTELNLITQAGVSTTSLLDQQFTKDALISKVNTVPFNVMHIATHGEFSSRAQDTYILAANGPINVTEFDEILRNRDEVRSEAVELLVLSACQTAAGDNRAALGLAGAAVKAGARSTLASLWQIDDESTALFIGAFYKELKDGKVTKAEALRRAQIKLLNHPNYNAPGFWSAYVLIGNWL